MTAVHVGDLLVAHWQKTWATAPPEVQMTFNVGVLPGASLIVTDVAMNGERFAVLNSRMNFDGTVTITIRRKPPTEV